jgi:hypothetical protein
MLCIHTDISNKPDLIVDDSSTSISHASDSELYSIVFFFFFKNSMCYYILLKKVQGQGQIQKNEVQDPYTLSQIFFT